MHSSVGLPWPPIRVQDYIKCNWIKFAIILIAESDAFDSASLFRVNILEVSAKGKRQRVSIYFRVHRFDQYLWLWIYCICVFASQHARWKFTKSTLSGTWILYKLTYFYSTNSCRIDCRGFCRHCCWTRRARGLSHL